VEIIMGRLFWRIRACAAASGAGPAGAGGRPVLRGVAAISAVALLGTGAGAQLRGMLPGGGGGPVAAPTAAPAAASYRSIILPSLLIVAPKGLTGAQIARLRRIGAIRDMITFDGAEITANGRPASVIGVNPITFRSWVPLRTASDQAFWSALEHGEFVASTAARARLGLRRGGKYLLRAATSQAVQLGAAAALGITGVDLLVNKTVSGELGLVHRVAALINAPGGRLDALIRKVRHILGPKGKVVSLRPAQLPVAKVASGQLPSSYLQLFKASAAEYCPGLSWTVLAAIGQIESADGTNNGPSKAGALGPMQFLPSTWAVWGIDGFGLTGKPDVMNPYDAVPSAARMLCADGAVAGAAGLREAIFDYNHAHWYVNEVLALAAEYAADFR
jgi:Transglycosylase SLT domain